MTDTAGFDYYYGDESEQFSVYRIPRQLVTGEAFRRLSTDELFLVEQGNTALYGSVAVATME